MQKLNSVTVDPLFTWQRVEHHKLDQSWHGANMRERGREWEGKLTTQEHAIYLNIVTVLLLKTNNICLQSYVSRIYNARTLRIRSRNHLSVFFFSTLHWESGLVALIRFVGCKVYDAAKDSTSFALYWKSVYNLFLIWIRVAVGR